MTTGLPRLSETATPQDPTVGPCLGSYGGARGGGRFLLSEVSLYVSRYPSLDRCGFVQCHHTEGCEGKCTRSPIEICVGVQERKRAWMRSPRGTHQWECGVEWPSPSLSLSLSVSPPLPLPLRYRDVLEPKGTWWKRGDTIQMRASGAREKTWSRTEPSERGDGHLPVRVRLWLVR